MKKYFFSLLGLCSFFWAQAQVPLHTTRTATSNSVTLKDSAQKSITLSPNFQFLAVPNSYYETTITGGMIDMEWPKDNQVVQRQNTNEGWVYIKGNCSDVDIDSVKVQANVVQGGSNKTIKLPVEANGAFEGAIRLTGGDYNITISEYFSNGHVLINGASKTINRVGIGEVILAWGHSFMEGDTVSEPAVDPRSRTVKYVFAYPPDPNPYFQDLDALPITFEKITSEIGPFIPHTWSFGKLADDLVSRLQVPVLILNSSFGGSNVKQNKNNIYGEPFDQPFFSNFEENGFPFRAVQASTKRFLPFTGIRAVIVHHGVNDYYYANEFASNYQNVLNEIRFNELSFPTVSMYLAFENIGNTDINNSIQSIISADPNIYPGIDLRDPATIGPWRDEGYGCVGCGHFRGPLGLQKHFELWRDALPTSLFTSHSFKEPTIDNQLKNN